MHLSKSLTLSSLHLPGLIGLRIKAASPSQMPALIQRHTASVMFFTGGLSKLGSSPTRMAEVLGCGRPIVANAGVGDVADLICSRNVGILVDSADKDTMDVSVQQLLCLLKDSQLATRCRSAAEDLFSLEVGTNSYRQIYSDLLV